MHTIEIDKDKCTQCGLCISDCVSSSINFGKDNFPEMMFAERCIACQHCLAICPTGALSFDGKNPENSNKAGNKDILTLIKSRRSIRQFKKDEISEADFEKLKEMLPYIPTGCNSHSLHFSIVEKREVMDILRKKVNAKILKLFSYKILSPITKRFEIYRKSFEKGDDIVFRNAPHMIVVSSPITAPCASVDPIIALSYLELYAQQMGLGTCWCGYAEMCIKIFPELSEILEIPKGYVPVYAMLLGIPAVKYQRTTQPEKYKITEIKDVIPKDSCLFCKTKRFITNFLR